MQPVDPTTVLPNVGGHGAAGAPPDWAAIAATLKLANNAVKYARNALADGLNNYADQGRRSDNWAVDGKHAAGGAALLATDQDGGLLNPPFWRLSHLDSVTFGSGTVQAAGLSAPAMPGVQLGHNAKVGWTSSTAGYDACDAYIETLAKGSSTVIVHDGQNFPLLEVPATIRLEMEGKWAPQKKTIQVSPLHGPILPESCKNGYCVAIDWAGAEVGDEVNALIDLLFVDDVASGLDALAAYRHGANNWILADDAGRIGYAAPGAIPVRENWQTWPPFLPLPGVGEHDWSGEVAGDADFRLENPPAGYLAAANNDIFGVLQANDPLSGSTYYYGNADLGYRAGRIVAALRAATAKGGVTLAQMQALQLDNYSAAAESLLPYLFQAVKARPDLIDADMTVALGWLSAWDFTMPSAAPNAYLGGVPSAGEVKQAVGAALFNYWFADLIDSAFAAIGEAGVKLPGNGAEDGPQFETKALLRLLEHPELSAWGADNWWALGGGSAEALVGALRSAVTALAKALGDNEDAWVWGAVHQATYQTSINSMGLPDFLLAEIGPLGIDGGFFTVNLGNPDALAGKMKPLLGVAARLTMELDGTADPTWAALPGGQSERVSSPHFNDLMTDFAAGGAAPVYFTLEEIAPATTARIQFVPR